MGMFKTVHPVCMKWQMRRETTSVQLLGLDWTGTRPQEKPVLQGLKPETETSCNQFIWAPVSLLLGSVSLLGEKGAELSPAWAQEGPWSSTLPRA